MSVSALSHANASTFGQARSVSLQNASREPNVFAAMLENARQLEQVDAVRAQGAQSVNQSSDVNLAASQISANANGNVEFAQALANAKNTQNLNNNAQLNELYLRNVLNPFQASEALGIDAANAIYGVQGSTPVANNNSNDTEVNLENRTLDFTALLPVGTRNFMKDLNCDPQEMDGFINSMIFGSTQGPQGQNAAEFFGVKSLKAQELSDSLNNILDQAKLNTLDVHGEDYNFVLREQNSPLGQTIAVNNGESLAERALDRDLEGTFKRDMALMQILARSNNQSANIF